MAIHAIGVIGAGAMGSGIAQLAAVAGLGVTQCHQDQTVQHEPEGSERMKGKAFLLSLGKKLIRIHRTVPAFDT